MIELFNLIPEGLQALGLVFLSFFSIYRVSVLIYNLKERKQLLRREILREEYTIRKLEVR